MHEASLHEENCFITLTYDDEHLPENGSLVKRDLQLFFKRWRKMIAPKKVRFYAAGEYGEDSYRPHFHAIVFGHMPAERYALPSKVPRNNVDAGTLSCSPELESAWGKGFSTVGEVSPASCSYVAAYVMKKVDQVGRKPRYSVDPETGESHEIEREYSTMSRGGRKKGHFGIGAGWYDRYGEEVERLESVRFGDQDVQAPRYYDELLRERDAAAHEHMKYVRWRKSRRPLRNPRWLNDVVGAVAVDDEMMARELIAKARLMQATRRL